MVAPAEQLGSAGLPTTSPYAKGYRAPDTVRAVVAAAHRTRLARSVAAALADHAVALGLTVGAAWTVLHLPWPVAALAVAVAAAGLARQLRALEAMVHEGSHFNWSRHHRTTNDVLALLLAGAATGAQVRDYRTSHLRHHGRFGTAEDPDRTRYAELDLEQLPRTSYLALGRAILVRLPRYQLGWLETFGDSRGAVLLPLVWVAVVVLPVGALLLGPAGGLVAAGVWLLGLLVALPVVRLLGESSEHVYSDATTVFDATVSNLGGGQRFFLHPHNDGYHTLHHLWPGVPHHQLRRLHEELLLADPDGYGARLRARHRLLEHPVLRPAPRPGGA